MKTYFYLYKITNNINNHFYYGIHKTSNLDDGYMGSGTRLRAAYKKYGRKWMYKDDEIIRLPEEKFEEYLNNGWKFGKPN